MQTGKWKRIAEKGEKVTVAHAQNKRQRVFMSEDLHRNGPLNGEGMVELCLNESQNTEHRPA